MELNYYLVGKSRYEAMEVKPARATELVALQPHKQRIEAKVRDIEGVVKAHMYPLGLYDRILIGILAVLLVAVVATGVIFLVALDRQPDILEAKKMAMGEAGARGEAGGFLGVNLLDCVTNPAQKETISCSLMGKSGKNESRNYQKVTFQVVKEGQPTRSQISAEKVAQVPVEGQASVGTGLQTPIKDSSMMAQVRLTRKQKSKTMSPQPPNFKSEISKPVSGPRIRNTPTLTEDWPTLVPTSQQPSVTNIHLPGPQPQSQNPSFGLPVASTDYQQTGYQLPTYSPTTYSQLGATYSINGAYAPQFYPRGPGRQLQATPDPPAFAPLSPKKPNLILNTPSGLYQLRPQSAEFPPSVVALMFWVDLLLVLAVAIFAYIRWTVSLQSTVKANEAIVSLIVTENSLNNDFKFFIYGDFNYLGVKIRGGPGPCSDLDSHRGADSYIINAGENHCLNFQHRNEMTRKKELTSFRRARGGDGSDHNSFSLDDRESADLRVCTSTALNRSSYSSIR